METTGSVELSRNYFIDMSEWTAIAPSFTKLNGRSKTITLSYLYTSTNKIQLFTGLYNKEIFDLIIKTDESSFSSGSLFGKVTNSYIYHVNLILSYGATLMYSSGSDGFIASEISSSTMLNVGITSSSYYSISIDYTDSSYATNIGLIAGLVKGTCYFAGIFVSSRIKTKSSSAYDRFGGFFGLIHQDADVVITTSVIDVNYLYTTSSTDGYIVGLIIGQNNGNVELHKVLVSVSGSANQIVSSSCSLSFGSVVGSNYQGKLIITDSFIYNIISSIDVYSDGKLNLGGVVGESLSYATGSSSTVLITNTSVTIKFINSKIPAIAYGGFIIGFIDHSPTIALTNSIFAVHFDSSYNSFVLYDIGNHYSSKFTATKAYYYYTQYGSHTASSWHDDLLLLNGDTKNHRYYLDDFSYNSNTEVVYYSKMAYISSYGIEDAYNQVFGRVDITFTKTKPSYSNFGDNFFVLDHIPSYISALRSNDYYLVFMPKLFGSDFEVSFYRNYECVYSSYLPKVIKPASNGKIVINFKCRYENSFELMIFSLKYSTKYFYKTIDFDPNGSDGGSDDDYDPRESYEKLITQILIGVNAGVATLIVLLSVCCYFINRK